MPVDDESFRYTLGHFASGVTVVTCAANGRMHGTTVSAFCSVSLQPPLVLVCLDLRSTLCEMIETARAFVVNVLAYDQELIARHFASRIDDRLAEVESEVSEEGQPLLRDVLATIECHLAHTCDGGDHRIYIGEVQRTKVSEGKPLLYYRGGYRSLSD